MPSDIISETAGDIAGIRKGLDARREGVAVIVNRPPQQPCERSGFFVG